MAQYEEAASTVLDHLTGLTDSTVATIQSILESDQIKTFHDYHEGDTLADGTQVAYVSPDTHLTQDPGVPVIIASDNTQGADVTFSADSQVQAVVLGSGKDTVAFQSDKDITVSTGGGNDSVATGAGDDHLDISGSGNVTVNTGDGNDVVNLRGDGTAHITDGAGDMTIMLQNSSTAATIDAGDGFDHLVVSENRDGHQVTFDSTTGTFVMHDKAVSMTGVDVVAFDTNNDGQITGADNITILATTSNDALVGKLYQVALGREAIDGADGWGNSTLGGINWWMNQFEKQDSDNSVEHLVRSFLNCDEFHAKYDAMSNADYVNTLFQNLGQEDANLAATYLQQLDAGTKDRAQVAWDLAQSDQATQILGIDGHDYVVQGS